MEFDIFSRVSEILITIHVARNHDNQLMSDNQKRTSSARLPHKCSKTRGNERERGGRRLTLSQCCVWVLCLWSIVDCG